MKRFARCSSARAAASLPRWRLQRAPPEPAAAGAPPQNTYLARCAPRFGRRCTDSRLTAGESLVVFAEGTFRRDPGLLPFCMGAFSAAAAANATVVPVAIRGSRTMLPDGAVLPRPAALDVIMGEPLSPEDSGWRTAVKLRSCAREHILGEVHEPDLEQMPGRALS